MIIGKINKNILEKDFERNKSNMLAVSWINFIGCPLYYIICIYILPQPYDSIILRGLSSIISIPLLFTPFYLKKHKPYIGIYWYLYIIYILPVIFTFLLLMNDFSGIWLIAQTIMLFIVIILVSNIILISIILLTGIITAYLCFIFYTGNAISINTELLEYLAPMPLAILGGLLFSYNAKRGLIAQEKTKILQSLGGSIAHEMRNPLSSIKQSSLVLNNKIQNFINSKNTKSDSSNKKISEIIEISELISKSSIRGNLIIDIILSNINDKEIDYREFKIFQISQIIDIAIKEFAFEEGEKEKISIDIKDNFYFKGDENLMIFVLFNLLKNSLYYLKIKPKSTITIYSKQDKNLKDNDKFNYLYFKDTGVGIPKDNLESIFESFMSSAKKGGTGLGLPFCKRVITAFNGKITCNSELGKYTEFKITLPKINKEDSLLIKEEKNINKYNNASAIIKANYPNKTILIVDDQSVNRIITENRLKELKFNVISAKNGQDALNILDKKGNNIDLIFMDLNMPGISGYETVKLIRLGEKNKSGEKFNKNNFKNYHKIPIIAFTSNDETKENIIKNKMNGLMKKDWNNEGFLEILLKL
jgi:two-component system, CAI-1 autoinducer sensor kinase/phosphatase CqsS